jgi:hypothetical protein
VGPVRIRVLDNAQGVDPKVLVVGSESNADSFFVDGGEFVPGYVGLKIINVREFELEMFGGRVAPNVA